MKVAANPRIEQFIETARRVFNQQQRRLKTTAQRFNVFEAIAFAEYELQHSRFLAYLLDPKEHHDQGSDFLRSFLDFIGLSGMRDLEVTQVATEYILPTQRRLDVLLDNHNEFSVVIENKVRAHEGNEQVSDYIKWLSDQRAGSANRRLVYLTPSKATPNSVKEHKWLVAVSYGELAEWLEGSHRSLPTPLDTVIRMYVAICRKLSGGNIVDHVDKAISEFLSIDGNLEIGLAVAKWAEHERTAVFANFWNRVKGILDERIVQEGYAQSWGTRISKQIRSSGTTLTILPNRSRDSGESAAGWDPPCYSVMVWNSFGENEGCFYGLRGIGPVKEIGQDTMPLAQLTERLKDQGFTRSGWALGWKWFEGQFPVFNSSNDQSVIKLSADNSSERHVLAEQMSDLLWKLFSESRMELEELNSMSAPK